MLTGSQFPAPQSVRVGGGVSPEELRADIDRLAKSVDVLANSISAFFTRLNGPGALTLTQTAIQNCTIEDSTVGATTPAAVSATTISATGTISTSGAANGAVQFTAVNATSDTAANSGFIAGNTAFAKFGAFRYHSAAFTTSGIRVADSVALFSSGATGGVNVGTIDAYSLSLWANNTKYVEVTSAGNVVLGSQAAIATNATNGFAYVPTCAGTPTGVPTAYTGKAAIVVDSTNNKLYFYTGAWRDAGP